MKKLSFAALSGAILLLSGFAVVSSGDWRMAEDYAVKFAGEEVEGVFGKMSGDISFDENDLETAKFAFTVDVNSIKTGNATKNKHARSEKWLDAEKYPVIRFTSSKFIKTANGYSAEGTLDMHGTQKLISIPFTFSGNVFRSNFSVRRADYGVGTLKGLSKQVSNAIRIDVSVPVTKNN